MVGSLFPFSIQFLLILVKICEADSTTKYDSNNTVLYSDSDSDGPLFVFEVSSDSDDEHQDGPT